MRAFWTAAIVIGAAGELVAVAAASGGTESRSGER